MPVTFNHGARMGNPHYSIEVKARGAGFGLVFEMDIKEAEIILGKEYTEENSDSFLDSLILECQVIAERIRYEYGF